MTPVSEDAITIADRTAAGKILSSPRRRAEYAFLVSIGAPHEREPAGFQNMPKRLRLVFEDASSQQEGGPAQEDMEALVAFARHVDLHHGKLLVHCQAGISRSSAAAIIVLAVLLGPGNELAAVEHIRRTHPHVRPNRRMLELADVELGANGGLLAAAGSGSKEAAQQADAADEARASSAVRRGPRS